MDNEKKDNAKETMEPEAKQAEKEGGKASSRIKSIKAAVAIAAAAVGGGGT